MLLGFIDSFALQGSFLIDKWLLSEVISPRCFYPTPSGLTLYRNQPEDFPMIKAQP